MSARTVYGITGYDFGGNSGNVVYHLFTSRAEAERWAALSTKYPYEVEEFQLYDAADEIAANDGPPDPYSW